MKLKELFGFSKKKEISSVPEQNAGGAEKSQNPEKTPQTPVLEIREVQSGRAAQAKETHRPVIVRPPSQRAESVARNDIVHSKPENNESLEKIQKGFSSLITQLEKINSNMDTQINQQKDLIQRLDKMPELAKHFPTMVENQEKFREHLSQQLENLEQRDNKLIGVMSSIPQETSKQNNILKDVKDKLAAGVEIDQQVVEQFGGFNDSLKKLDQSTLTQNDSILQMSKTFATSDRYLKYVMNQQSKKFTQLLVISLGICFACVAALVVLVVVLNWGK